MPQYWRSALRRSQLEKERPGRVATSRVKVDARGSLSTREETHEIVAGLSRLSSRAGLSSPNASSPHACGASAGRRKRLRESTRSWAAGHSLVPHPCGCSCLVGLGTHGAEWRCQPSRLRTECAIVRAENKTARRSEPFKRERQLAHHGVKRIDFSHQIQRR
jgi:hypothetical protein